MKNEYTKKRKITGAVILVLIALVCLAAIWDVSARIIKIGNAPDDVKRFVRSFGWAGWLVALGLQFLQIVVAFIPGELIETGMGYAFGAWSGTVLCYVGLALGELTVFVIIRRFGERAAGYFVPIEKLEKFRNINDGKLKKTLFILFIIPGTPKDLLTYFAPLTRITLSEFMSVSLIARFPSIVSSTVGGSMLSGGEYLNAALLYAATGILSIAGVKVYNTVLAGGRKKRTDRI